jgi:hypothetical protein
MNLSMALNRGSLKYWALFRWITIIGKYIKQKANSRIQLHWRPQFESIKLYAANDIKNEKNSPGLMRILIRFIQIPLSNGKIPPSA